MTVDEAREWISEVVSFFPVRSPAFRRGLRATWKTGKRSKGIAMASSKLFASGLSRIVTSKRGPLREHTIVLLARTPTLPPDQWGALFRTYGPSSDRPGPRDPSLTPYMIPIERALAARRHKRVVGVMGAQMAKTESFLDVIGQRLDQRPTPIIYVGRRANG